MNLVDFLIKNNLAISEFEARGLILSGKVLLNDVPATKLGTTICERDRVRLRGIKAGISRSAGKLAPLLDKWQFPVQQKDFMDIGSSTGGFTQTLLQKGAARVICVDVGYGLLHESLRKNKQVYLFERTNILHIEPSALPFLPENFTADVSFISLRRILPKLTQLRRLPSAAALLFKPQFELPRKDVHLLENGILKDSSYAEQMLFDFIEFAKQHDWQLKTWDKAPVKGKKGNQEYFLYLTN